MADTIHGEELKEKKWWVPEEEEEEYLDNVESKGLISLFNLLSIASEREKKDWLSLIYLQVDWLVEIKWEILEHSTQ